MASNRPQANLTLHIRSCIQGEVTPSPDSCLRCPPGSFSFEPTSTECTRCMPNAECVGGSVVIPKAGFWSSSATAGQTHRCVLPIRVWRFGGALFVFTLCALGSYHHTVGCIWSKASWCYGALLCNCCLIFHAFIAHNMHMAVGVCLQVFELRCLPWRLGTSRSVR